MIKLPDFICEVRSIVDSTSEYPYNRCVKLNYSPGKSTRMGVPLMSTPLLTTKLYIPPIRSKILSRPKLLSRIDSSIGKKLTLISAPAGFGKTTLLGDWIATRNHNVAWISLDNEDNDA